MSLEGARALQGGVEAEIAETDAVEVPQVQAGPAGLTLTERFLTPVRERFQKLSTRSRRLGYVAVAGVASIAIASGVGGGSKEGGSNVAFADQAADACGVDVDLDKRVADHEMGARGSMFTALVDDKGNMLNKDDAVASLQSQVAQDYNLAGVLSELYALQEDNDSPNTLTEKGIDEAVETLKNDEESNEKVADICTKLTFIAVDKKFAINGGDAGEIQFVRNDDGVKDIKVTEVERDRVEEGYVVGANLDDSSLDESQKAFLRKFSEDAIYTKDGRLIIRKLKAPNKSNKNEGDKGDKDKKAEAGGKVKVRRSDSGAPFKIKRNNANDQNDNQSNNQNTDGNDRTGDDNDGVGRGDRDGSNGDKDGKSGDGCGGTCGDSGDKGGDTPTTGGDKPSTGGDNPSTGGDNPPTGGDNPPTGGDKPPVVVNPPEEEPPVVIPPPPEDDDKGSTPPPDCANNPYDPSC